MSAKKTHEQYVQEVQNVHGDQITVIGQYVNARTKIQHRCKKCQTVWTVEPNKILNGRGCRNLCFTVPNSHGSWDSKWYSIWHNCKQVDADMDETWKENLNTFIQYCEDTYPEDGVLKSGHIRYLLCRENHNLGAHR